MRRKQPKVLANVFRSCILRSRLNPGSRNHKLTRNWRSMHRSNRRLPQKFLSWNGSQYLRCRRYKSLLMSAIRGKYLRERLINLCHFALKVSEILLKERSNENWRIQIGLFPKLKPLQYSFMIFHFIYSRFKVNAYQYNFYHVLHRNRLHINYFYNNGLQTFYIYL